MSILNSVVEKKAQAACDLSIFKGFDLEKAKEILSEMLSDIGKHGIFTEYTKHDISHVDGMLKLLEFIIPENTANIMTPTDWMMIVLSIYFHDLGMLITRKEFSERADNADFQKYCRNYSKELGESLSQEEKDKQKYQDFVRENHGNRICKWIKSIGDQPDADNAISKMLYDMLHYVDENFRKDLAEICKSHSEAFSDCKDFRTDQPYAQGDEYQSNLLYVAAILRTADLMHINYERTPTTAYLLISPKDQFSRQEWVKQKSITSIRPKKEFDKDGKLDTNAKIHRFEVIGRFKDSSAYKSLMSYLDDAETQLKETHEICKDSMERFQNGYDFPWDEICRDEIKPLNFSGTPLKFDLDTKNILNLLVGHTLYSQMNVVLRELAQNSIDAVRLMERDFKEGDDDYIPKVWIEWDSQKRVLSVKDNGTGMNEDIIRNYLMKVGASRYQSDEFIASNKQFHSISRFGIGVLTCFMISDDFRITTKFSNDDKVYAIEVGGMEKEFMLRYDADSSVLINKEHGTTIELNVRQDAKIDDIEVKLREWVIVPGCQVSLIIDGNDPVSIGYSTEKEAITSYLRSQGISLDTGDYKLENNQSGCATIYYLLNKNKTFGYWQICSLGKTRHDPLAPIGIAIEGIRVSSNTPGFDTRRYFVMVNCKGKESPSTNVARDRIEDSEEMIEVLRSVYKTYLKTILDQVDSFSSKYSLPWASQRSVFQIDNLLNERYEGFGLTDRNLFDDCLRHEKFMLVDDGYSYKMESINGLPEKIWTMENHAYSSAVSLVQEIHDCAKTPLGITKELMPDGKITVDKVYTGEYFNNYLSELFLQTYQVNEIKVDSSLRKLEFCWQKNGKFWYQIELNSGRHHMREVKLFIQKSEEIVVKAEEGIIGIKSNLGFFLLSNNELNKLLCNLFEIDDERSNAAIQTLGQFTISILGRWTKFEEKELDKFFNSDENYLRGEIWDVIGPQAKFIDKIKDLSFKTIDFSKFYVNEMYM